MTYGNGLVEMRSYNPRLQPTEMRSYNPATQDDVLKLSYGFAYGTANNGNVMTWAATGAQSFNRSYTYDELNRLKTMSAPGEPCSGLSWTYDIWANRLAQTATGGSCGQSQITINTLNRIADPGYGYDAAGNLTTEPGKTYTYDAENRLTSIGGGSVATYIYNAEGRRVRKIAGGTTTEYIYDLAGNVVAERVGTTWTRGYVYLNGQLVAQYSSGTTYFVHKDHLGSTRVLTKLDKTPLEPPYDYLPYGESNSCTGANATPRCFTGHPRDPESGLDYFGARYYLSISGRFHSTDPVVVTAERMEDPQQLNLYSYTRNSPIVFIDPTGKILTVSGNTEEAKRQICQMIGGDCSKMSYDSNTNTIPIEADEEEIERNEGMSLLRDLVNSSNRYDLFVGSRAETKAGPGKKNKDLFDVTHAHNLDNLPDDRLLGSKTDKLRPKDGIDSQVLFNPDSIVSSETGKKPAVPYTTVFHELAEAYARVDKGKPYDAAHREAKAREVRLREQRPYLREHNYGSGPGDRVRPVIKR